MIRGLGLFAIVATLGCGAHPVLGRARITRMSARQHLRDGRAISACWRARAALTFGETGRPETIGATPSTCVGLALLAVQPAPEFGSMVVRLERR